MLSENSQPTPAIRAPVPLHPFRQFIVKLHSRCNLACDYCYVYSMADQRWRTRPRSMDDRVVKQTAARIGEHARRYQLNSIDVILHGGEPLLAGPTVIAQAVRDIRAAASADTTVRVTVQTNGTGLDTRFLRLFADLDIRVSVSLDGDQTAHDRHRRFADGRGSHASVSQALRWLTQSPHRSLFNGLLCTVDLRADPIASYAALIAFAPPMIDFLLPHGNWTAPPPGRPPDRTATPYADWLIAIFDRWYSSPLREVRVRLFEEIMHVLLGGSSRLEGVGLSPVAFVVIETDGAIESADILGSTYDGAAATGLHVAHNPLDAALTLPAIRARQSGAAGLSEGCRRCTLHRSCGGGLYAHRYRKGSGFDNASVYCADLYRLITYIKDVLKRDIAQLRTTHQ
jgi:Arylsulfatase regulator (Fe-S oxidoreductase)